jgi:hypothetical protein
LARLFVIKHRDGKSRFVIHLEYDYSTLKIREISENKYKQIFYKYKNERIETVAEHTSKIEQAEKIMAASSKKKKENELINAFSSDVGYSDVEDAPIED